MFKIEGYSYNRNSIETAKSEGILPLEVLDYKHLSIRAYFLMRKASLLFVKAQNAAKPSTVPKAKKLVSGQRWITVHPNGDESKGIPVLIQDHGDGTAHVIAGAGGKLNMLKLNNIKSPEEYKQIVEQKKLQEKMKKEAKKRAEKEMLSKMSKEERKEYRKQKKLKKKLEKEHKEELKQAKRKAEEEFVNYVREVLGWQEAVTKKEPEDGSGIMEKVRQRVQNRKHKNLLSQAKEVVRNIQKEIINDEILKEDVYSQIDQPGVEDVLDRERGKGLGFRPGYKEAAQEKGDLSEEKLEKEKAEVFEKRMQELETEKGPRVANFIRAGVETNRKINKLARDIYQKQKFEKRIEQNDKKVEVLKKYLEMKKKLEAIEQEEKKDIEDINQTLEGIVDVQEVPKVVHEAKYGNGVKIDYEVTDREMVNYLMQEKERLEAERQANINKSLLNKIKDNPNGAEKWIANGNYNGFNSIVLTALKGEGLDRDVVDILGVGNSAKLTAMLLRKSMDPEDYEVITQAIEDYHKEVNGTVVREAIKRGEELLNRAKSIELEMANNPDDLTVMNQLNETRLEYLDEANRVLGQALGSLEASAAMVVELKRKEDPEKIDVNLGKTSNQDAIIKMRALGLREGDYEISTINGEKICAIKKTGIDKIVRPVSKEEMQMVRAVEAIKSGAEDEEGWLPEGIVSRPESTFEDPETKDKTLEVPIDFKNPDLHRAIEDHIAQRLLDGADIDTIRQDLYSGEMAADVPKDKEKDYYDVLKNIFPEYKNPDEEYVRGLVESYIKKNNIGEDYILNSQKIPHTEQTVEAIHRSLGVIPEGAFAFKKVDDLTPQEQTDLRRYWDKNIYQGKEGGSEKDYQIKEARNPVTEWNRFKKESAGNHYEIIKQDLIDNHSEEDMFGEKIIPPLARVQEGNLDTYRQIFPDKVYFDDMRQINPEKLMKEAQKEYEKQMRDHFYRHMRGFTQEELEAGSQRKEKSPWGEYVRAMGGVKEAYGAVLSKIRSDFIEEYAKHHGRVYGEGLKVGNEKIDNWERHLIAIAPKDIKERALARLNAEQKSALAKVAKREGGKFSRGARKELAEALLAEMKKDDKQLALFKEKIEDPVKRTTIGKRAEAQLKSLIPGVAANFRRGERVKVFANLTMSSEKHIHQQRAIKMFEKVKRMNLTFGTGKGKSITSIGAFTNLKAKGKVKRAIFAVPSVVQAQFGGEMLKYTKPGKYKWSANPELNQEQRLAALKNGNLDMVVFTHQSLRDDLIHLMSEEMGKTQDEMKEYFNNLKPEERRELLRKTLDKNGIDLDMLVVDESHYAVNRAGKKDSTLSNILDALGQSTPYMMLQSATPVKNDASEAFDMLRRVDPERFKDRDEFLKRYGVDTQFAKESLQRLISRYNYASPTVTGVKRNHTRESVKLGETREPKSGMSQKEAYKKVEEAFRSASRAQRNGKVDVEAVKYLSPNSFKGVPENKHEETARLLQQSVGVIKEEALNRVVNQFPWQHNAKVQKVLDIVSSKVYKQDHKSGAKAGDRQPGVIFAHNIESLSQLRQALESQGYRVGLLQGAMNGEEKERVKNAFNPVNPKDRQYDILLCSDAGATGLNLQNAKWLINFDLPHTSWVKEQREGRIDRHGQLHDEIDYHDIVSNTEHEKAKWERIQRKAELGSVFQLPAENLDDTGLAGYITKVRENREAQGLKVA